MDTYWQRWHFTHYFLRELFIDFPLSVGENDVRKKLDDKFGHDNWISSSLKRGKKVKEKNAHKT